MLKHTVLSSSIDKKLTTEYVPVQLSAESLSSGMPGFFFRPIDLSSLALFFVAGLVAWRLWTLRPRTSAGSWLRLFFTSAGLFALTSVVASARLDTWQFYAVHLQIVFSALGTAGLLQYAYRVGEIDPDEVEARRVGWISLAAFACIAAWCLYQLGQLNPAGSPSTSTAISEGLIGAGLLWTLVVTIRQARYANAQPALPGQRRSLTMLLVGITLLTGASSFQFIGGVLAGFAPQTVYTVYVVALAVIVIGFNYFLDWDQANRRVNRLIAAALVLLQSVFAVLAVLYAAQLVAENSPVSISGERSMRFTPAGGGYQLTEGSQFQISEDWVAIEGDNLIIQPEFRLPFFGQEYDTLLVRPGRVLFGQRWSAQKANYFLQPHIVVINLAGASGEPLKAEVSQSERALAVRWTLPAGGLALLAIEPDGVLTISYTDMAEQPVHSWGLSAGRGLEGVEFLQEFPQGKSGMVPPAGILFERSSAGASGRMPGRGQSSISRSW